MMDEYIKREEAIEAAKHAWAKGLEPSQYLEIVPAADVAPVRHGRRIKVGYACGETEWQCSACKETEWRTSASRMKYCPFCDAMMDNAKEEFFDLFCKNFYHFWD